jgi:hypothetical protein
MVRPFLHLALAVLLATAARAAPDSVSENTRTPTAPPPILSRIGGLFTGDLPHLDPPGTMKVIVHPHFGDLVRRDYMRVETGLRWALNENFDITGEAAVYFTHGFRGSSAGYGIGKLLLGSNYDIEEWPRPRSITSFGLDIEAPVGRQPPIDMTDGHYHFAPHFIVQQESRRNPRLTVFGGMGLDLLTKSSVIGTFGVNRPHDDSVSITGGGIYDLGQFKWTFTGTYATTAGIGDRTDHFYYLQPGLLWYVPRKFTFNSKTQWIVGLKGRASWGPDGTDIGVSTRVRAEITFRQVMEKLRLRQSRARAP